MKYFSLIKEAWRDYDYSRKIFSLHDAFGDIGGIKELIMLEIGIFIAPYNQHNSDIKLLKNNFRLHIKNDNQE